MGTITPERREPITITCGDTINFQRNFRLYPAPAWVITYEIRGAGIPIEFVSAPATDGTLGQVVFVAGNVTESWPPGDYEMAGYASNATTGERYEIYHPSEIQILPDLQTAPGDQSTETFAQAMVRKLEAVLSGRATNDVLDSEINGTMIRRIPVNQLTNFYWSMRRQRQGEIAAQRARNGQPTGRNITTRINVAFPNPRGFGAGSIFRGPGT